MHTRHSEDGPPRGRLALRRLRARRRDAPAKGRLARHRIACVRSAAVRAPRAAAAAPLPGQEPGGEDQGSEAGGAEARSWGEGAREVNTSESRDFGSRGGREAERGIVPILYIREVDGARVVMASLRSGVSGFRLLSLGSLWFSSFLFALLFLFCTFSIY